MAYGIDWIDAVLAMATSTYSSDDISQDADVTDCMTNGTTGEDCDEWKEGTICGKVIIDVDPSVITSLSVRFYLNSIMTAGDNELLPYTDSNSVSTTYEVNGDYTSAGVWVEHVCSANFISELGDIGGGQCAVRLGSNDGAKSKIGEVNIDIGIPHDDVIGVTYDYQKNILGSTYVSAYKVLSTNPLVFASSPYDSTVSHGTTGAYTLSLYAGDWILIFFNAGSPDVMDISERITVTP